MSKRFVPWVQPAGRASGFGRFGKTLNPGKTTGKRHVTPSIQRECAAEQSRVLKGRSRSPGQFLSGLQINCVVASAGLGGHELQHPDHDGPPPFAEVPSSITIS